MNDIAQTMNVGNIKLTLFNVGDLLFDMNEGLAVPRHEWRPSDRAVFEEPVRLPVQCVLIQAPETTMLVDAGAYELETEPDLAPSGYVPPPSLPQQLAAIGVEPEQIQLIVITHAHFDHYNGLTQRNAEGDWQPVYPNATVFLGEEDWENDEMQRSLHSPDSLESRTLGFLHDRGTLTLVDGQRQVSPGIEIVPTPGETSGHIALRVESAGSVAYCVGDLYHHVVEVEMPTWSVTWADKAAIQSSRSRIAASVQNEEALLIATHIRGIGRLVSTSQGLRWETV